MHFLGNPQALAPRPCSGSSNCAADWVPRVGIHCCGPQYAEAVSLTLMKHTMLAKPAQSLASCQEMVALIPVLPDFLQQKHW